MRSHLRLLILLPLLASAFAMTLAAAAPVLAQTSDAAPPTLDLEPIAPAAEPLRTHTLPNPLQAGTIPELLGNAARLLTGIVGSIALLMFVYGGMLWMTSRGNSSQIEKGKNIFVWSTIGLLIMFSSYLIISFFLQTIGATS
ncbi:MAG: pilin [Patescibacteria group bacterium]|jgi:hypothetical protein